MDHPSRPCFHIMAKPVGPLCNLDCRYCFYLEKAGLYPGRGASPAAWAMEDRVLEAYVAQYLDASPFPEVTFTWQGGEPTLLGLDFFRRVRRLQERLGRGRRISNALQTNGVLLDDAWCAFLAAEGFLVGLSLDGPRELHDRYRVDRGGNPTFDRVRLAAALLLKHGVPFNTLTVVNRRNGDHPLEVYRFLREAGSGFMQFIPAVERVAQGVGLVPPDFQGEAEVAPWSVGPLQYGAFLCALFDEWVRHDVGSVFVQLFDVALASWMGMDPGLCVFQETCGAALALEHNGDVYACDHFVDPAHRLGNLLERGLGDLAGSAQQAAFGRAKRDALPGLCRACDVRFACNGECPRLRFARTPDGEPGLSYLCAGYKRFFRHIDPCMRFMAGELRADRAPANVMAWVDQSFFNSRTTRPIFPVKGNSPR